MLNLSAAAGWGDADNGGYPGEGVVVSLKARGVLDRDDIETGEESIACAPQHTMSQHCLSNHSSWGHTT